MDKREQYDLADRKGYNVTQSTTRDYVRLIGLDGNPVKNESGGAAYSYTEATRYLGGAAGSFDIAKAPPDSAGLCGRIFAYFT
jgi:hypothetical protein